MQPLPCLHCEQLTGEYVGQDALSPRLSVFVTVCFLAYSPAQLYVHVWTQHKQILVAVHIMEGQEQAEDTVKQVLLNLFFHTITAQS